MRGTTIAVAIALTLGYGYAAQAAMTAGRAPALRPAAGEAARAPAGAASAPAGQCGSPVWYGGTLAPITVVAHAADPVAARLPDTAAARSRRGA